MCYILFYPFTFPKYKFEFVFLPFTLRIYVANIMLHRRFQFVVFRTQFLLYGGDHFAQLSVYSIYCKYNKFEFVLLPFTLRIYVANIMLNRRLQSVLLKTQYLLYDSDHLTLIPWFPPPLFSFPIYLFLLPQPDFFYYSVRTGSGCNSLRTLFH